MITQQTSASRGPSSPQVTGFYEPDTGSIQYVASDPGTKKAAIIDAVWNFDPRNARTSTHSADEILRHVKELGLSVEWILDTHPHADHFMAGAYLKDRLGALQAIGEKVRDVAALWRALYHRAELFDVDSAFDRLLADGDTLKVGSLPVQIMFSPGHTLASITYVVGDDAAFVHDTLMYPDSARRAPISPAVMRQSSIGPSRRSSRCRSARVSSSATTTARTGASRNGRPPSPSTEARISTSRTAYPSATSSSYARSGTKLSRCPTACCMPCRSTCAAAGYPSRNSDGHSYFKIPANRL